ncbi:hypothetical protein QBC34DRAFT_430655 [Podospora aff. communis PSN243]|uniref:Uncharacterized protein n=1 Tax=Podospora aff. communis PSN243 TaxID=3040156 RepID=A0AAV9G877_9PEZI|nr:hypothetical protein QBC34DRAFT_430655 [Podospora aff. communis PSN243]
MPDLNSVPPSPHVLATAPRRASSQQMPPPPVPPSPSLNILPSNQSTVNNVGSSSSLPSPHFLPASVVSGQTMGDNTGVGPGPGPTRHPRPLTAADLHLQLEKEQEAVVNRLTRELTMLRAAHNASVVSNASSTSASASESVHLGEPQPAVSGPGLAHHRAPVHHRTSSNTSIRSIPANVGSVSTTSMAGISSPAPVRPSQPVLGGVGLSRQGSSASRRSRAGSPSPAPHSIPSHGRDPQGLSQPPSYTHSYLGDPGMANYFAHRGQTSSTSLHTSAATPGSYSELSPGILPATSRYEETAFYRAELDSVKKENEALKRRVRDLERMVRERRPSDASRASASASQTASRPRSDSVSTTASAAVSVAASTTGGGGVTIATQREGRDRPRVVSMLSTAGSIGVGVPEDEVRVGESAASAGLGERGAQDAQGPSQR